MIGYNMGTVSSRPEGTVATYTCNPGRLLSLLENARQEQADEQEEIGAVARTAWWNGKPKPPPTKNCESVRIRLEKEKNQLKVQICTASYSYIG